MKRLLAATIVALGVLRSAPGRGEARPPDYVVLLLPARETPTSRRLKAEVSKLDLEVHVSQTDEKLDPDEPRMAELARHFGGEALVWLSADGRVATIWFSQAGQGEKLKRVVQAESGSADLRSESVVVGTMELLRVRLLTRRNARVAEPPPPSSRVSPRSLPPLPPADYRPLSLGAVVGLDKPGSRFSFGASYQLSVDIQLSRYFALRALVRLPAASSQTTRDGATGEVRAVIAVVGGAFGFNVTPAFRLDAFAGGGTARVVAQGFAPVGRLAATFERSTWALVGAGGGRASLQIAPILNVTAQAGLTLAAAPLEVVINDQVAATWGRPALFLGLGVELRPHLR